MISNLRNLNITNLEDLSLDQIFELKIPTLLADYWITLGEQFPEIFENFGFIKYSEVASNQKIILILSQLKAQTHSITLERFIKALENIIPLIGSFLFFTFILQHPTLNFLREVLSILQLFLKTLMQ